MGEHKIFTDYLLPTMLQIILIAGVAAVLKHGGVETGYVTAIGILLIAAAGVSSALWGGGISVSMQWEAYYRCDKGLLSGQTVGKSLSAGGSVFAD